MGSRQVDFYIFGAFILVIALVIDIVHSFVRTRQVSSFTEALGKLLLGSLLSLCAVSISNRTNRSTEVLVIMSIIVLVVLFGQAIIYREQRDRTREYLKRLVKKKKGSDAVADVLAELVDAEFVPAYLGYRWSGRRRREIRILAAEWLKEVDIEVEADDLVVPENERTGVKGYLTLGWFMLFITIGYIILFIVTYQPTQAP